MHKRPFPLLAILAAALLLAAGLFVGVRATIAQEASPPAMDGMDMAGDSHPAHIHDGTCATLGGVVYPLENVEAPDAMGTPMAGMEMESTPMADMMGTPMPGMDEIESMSTTDVDATLDSILGAEHAINVHESADNIQNYIACGELTGAATDGMLEITLTELNDSGHEGKATLQDNGDGTTTVTVWLMSTDGAAEGMGTPTS